MPPNKIKRLKISFGSGPWTPEISEASTLTSSYTSLLLLCIVHLILHILHQIQGKMNIYSLFCILCQFYLSTSIKIKPELKKIILNFGYGINYKYVGMLVHSFNRFYVVTKFILPTIGDLNFSKLNYDDTCAYVDNKNSQNTEPSKYMLDLKTFCKKIESFCS